MCASSKILSAALVLQTVSALSAQPRTGTVLWSYDLGSSVLTSPALSPDGTIYLGTRAGLCAVTNNGITASNKWTLSATVSYSGSPAIAADGTIYVGAADRKLYAIKPDGSQRWSFPVQDGRGSAAIGYDDTVYFSGNDNVYAITPLGRLKWSSPGGDNGDSPVIGADGTIYIVSWDQFKRQALYALNPDGTRKWACSVQGPAADSPAIGSEGTIYVTAGLLYAFAPDGTQLWYSATNNFTRSSPAVAGSGNIYIRDFNYHTLDALNSSGQVNWRAFQDGLHTVPTVPVIDASGTIYYCFSNTLAAVTPQGTAPWTFTATPEYSAPASGSPLMDTNGTIYAVFGTKLYAVYGTNKPADSGWPMYRQNARRTGKIEKPRLQPPRKRANSDCPLQLYAESDHYRWQNDVNLEPNKKCCQREKND